MRTPQQLSKHFNDVFNGGNWTSVNLRDTLSDVNWQQATAKVADLNTIAVLVFHIGYYVSVMLKVLQGRPLQAHDKYSFDLPPITSEEDWQALIHKTFTEVNEMATLIAGLDEQMIDKDFADSKYGSYYRNLLGVIEHTHYHLGQISLLKKLMRT